MTKWWLMIKDHRTQSHWHFDQPKSREICKTLYFFFHKTYGKQTWQGDSFELGATNHKVTRPFICKIAWVHMKTWRYISYSTNSMTTKLCKVATQDKRAPITKSNDPLIKWLRGFTWQIKNVTSFFSKHMATKTW